MPACRFSHPLWLEKTRDVNGPASIVVTTRNAHARTGTGSFGAEGFTSTASTRPVARGAFPNPRRERTRGVPLDRTFASDCVFFRLRVNNDDGSLTSPLPRVRAPQAPGRSSQSSADVGVLRGRSRSQSNAEYVAFPARTPESDRFRCQVELYPHPTRPSVSATRSQRVFVASEGIFPRAAGRSGRHFPPARVGSADRRERTADRPVEAPTYVFADRPAPERDPPRARARAARGRPGRRFGTTLDPKGCFLSANGSD